jgi:hypothetical protein
MQDQSSFVTYQEIIQRGWFEHKASELTYILGILERTGRMSPVQTECLLQLAADQRARALRPVVEPGALEPGTEEAGAHVM